MNVDTSMIRHDIEIPSKLQASWDGNPPVNDGFPPYKARDAMAGVFVMQRASNAELYCLIDVLPWISSRVKFEDGVLPW